jgi:hypothetical protein
MEINSRQHGFSLVETLMAVATLAIGLLFIGGTLMTGVYLSTVSTERTMASVIADEAFAKIELYGLDPSDPALGGGGFVSYGRIGVMPAGEFEYPSTWVDKTPGRQYSWSAICRRVDPNAGLSIDAPSNVASSRLVQFTVFVCRETGAPVKHWVRSNGGVLVLNPDDPLPRPARVTIEQDTTPADPHVVRITDTVTANLPDEYTFINDGSTLVDEATGQIYRVLERSAAAPGAITLDRSWAGARLPSRGGVWVIPPGRVVPAGWVIPPIDREVKPPPFPGSRNPVVGIYQRTLEFEKQDANATSVYSY